MPGASQNNAKKPSTWTYALLLIAFVATIAPFWTVPIPPSTDLPQHLSQIFLFDQVRNGGHPELTITPWFYPNTLIYVPLYLFWHLSDPLTAGRLILSFLAGSWVLGTYALCLSRQRSVANWLLTVPITFNFLFYWGLLNFLIGWPIFCAFVNIASRPRSTRNTASLCIAALLLYYGHALWFLMANAWLFVHHIERDRRSRTLSLFAVAPSWMLALIWYPKLVSARQGNGGNTDMVWSHMPIERLNLNEIADAALGGLQGPLEGYFVPLLLLWIAVIIVTRRPELEKETDKPLLLAALLLILAYFILPSSYMNTIFFNARWLPCGMTLLLLSLPAPRIRKPYVFTLGIGCIAIMSATTIKAWKDWEEEQLGGFMVAMARIDGSDAVFGLDSLGSSLFIKGHPSLQLFSYAQALRGADINFSFTEHYSGIVQYRDKQAPNVSRNLVWTPLHAKALHTAGYNKVLINGDDILHDFFRTRLSLEEIEPSKSAWRLYRTRDNLARLLPGSAPATKH